MGGGIALLALLLGGGLLTLAGQARRPVEWGLYQIYWRADRYGPILRQEVANFESTPDYVMFYRDLGRRYPAEAVEAIRGIGATPIVSLELWRWHASNQRYLPPIAAGEYDAFFAKWAEDAKQDGQRVLLRFGFEFNGDWFTWSGQPELFVQAWRRIHDLFAQAGADNVEWVWSPNVTSVPDVPANDMHRHYPGDAYVDWVAVDGYNWGADHDQWHKWQTFDEVFAPTLDSFAERYPDKPVMIAETGCVEATLGVKAAWIRDAFAAVARRPQVRAVIWFNYDKRREGEPNWRLDTSAAALEAFNDTFAAPEPSPSPGNHSPASPMPGEARSRK